MRRGDLRRFVRSIANLFVMIGTEPNTEWLGHCLTLDAKGFAQTGSDERGRPLTSPFVTSRPGLFAVGGVRSGGAQIGASSSTRPKPHGPCGPRRIEHVTSV